MITEDYVSFEISKLLKEKGFDEPTLKFFHENGKEDEFYDSEEEKNSNMKHCCSRPSQSLALKWLREEHLYHIFAKPVQLKNRVDWRAYIIAEDCDTLPITIHGESPEQAVEAALKYTLENLI